MDDWHSDIVIHIGMILGEMYNQKHNKHPSPLKRLCVSLNRGIEDDDLHPTLLLSINRLLVDGAAPHLEKLTIMNFSVRRVSIYHLSRYIEDGGWPNLVKLTIAETDLGDEGLTRLARAMQACPHRCSSLRELCLYDNPFEAEGVRSLASAFQHGACPNLATLISQRPRM